ncbi:MAG: VOC family protein [Betaproteobacteria bacterium]|nr:VOC family protein [Betaproteobacteria bacterium]
MIDHLGITVSKVSQATAFFSQALAPLGYSLIIEFTGEQAGGFIGAGFGVAPKPDFWISQGTPEVPPVHVAFRAAKRTEVDAFYAAALAAGGRDNGRPGLRPHYHPSYYGAFVLDADGNNIEAVCHAPE